MALNDLHNSLSCNAIATRKVCPRRYLIALYRNPIVHTWPALDALAILYALPKFPTGSHFALSILGRLAISEQRSCARLEEKDWCGRFHQMRSNCSLMFVS